tara:strand:+ start:866 stop:1066 length:201 start_codon:yes stop_codon:yes gene_type:complete
MLETLNWLTITTPFIAGFTAYQWGQGAGEGKTIPALVGLLAFLGLIFIWYILYQFTQFPFWMTHFN